MGDYTELPVFKSGYHLVLEVFRVSKDFQKEYKYTVGERIRVDALELMTLVFRLPIRAFRLWFQSESLSDMADRRALSDRF